MRTENLQTPAHVPVTRASIPKSNGRCTKISCIFKIVGGGLYVQQDSVWFIRGIVSSSLIVGGVCDVMHNALYTQISSFADWINSTMMSSAASYTFVDLHCKFVSRYFLLTVSAGQM